MKALLILNRAAGTINGERGAVAPEEIRDAFAAAGLAVELEPASGDDLAARFRAAVRARPDAVIAGGGDGTLSTAAACLADSGIPLGALPLGTLNHFARDLGVPVDWREAVVALAHGRIRAVDLGEVNGRVFINNCSIGSYPEAVRHRDELRRTAGRGKWAAMLLASLAVFRRLRRFRVRIDLPDASLELRTPFIFVGNNPYSGHLLGQSLRPRLDAGMLAIYTTRARRRFTLLRLAWQALVRRIDEADALEIHHAVRATIAHLHGRPLPVAVDGELVRLEAPLRLRIRPGALHVISPGDRDAPPLALRAVAARA